MAERIRLSRAKGWRLPQTAVNVARPGRWGNPFVVGKHGTRLQCAAKFGSLAGGFIAFEFPETPGTDIEAQLRLHTRLRKVVQELGGKDLACWCPIDGAACHADVLLYLANPGHPRPAWMAGPIDLPRVRLGLDAAELRRMKRAKAKLERGEQNGAPQ